MLEQKSRVQRKKQILGKNGLVSSETSRQASLIVFWRSQLVCGLVVMIRGLACMGWVWLAIGIAGFVFELTGRWQYTWAYGTVSL